MPKRTVAYLWIVGLAALGLAVVLVLPSAVALAAHVEVSGPSGSRLVADGYVIIMAVLILVGGLLAMAGVAAQLVAWVGAVLSAH